MLQMSQRDRDRLMVIRQVARKEITVSRGTELLGLCREQVARLRDRYLVEGDRAVIHRARGRRANNAKPEAWRRMVLEEAEKPVFHDFAPTLLAEHLSRDPAIGRVNPYTLRRWLIEEGRWTVKARGARHRKARPRKAAVGELVQWDSSDHAWLEDRYPKRLTLVTMIDDATNRLQYARFVEQDNGQVNREAVITYLERYGRPLAFYADQAGHFIQETRSADRGPMEQREAQLTESIIRRGLRELGVELIRARSPQGKGRVERDYGTAQDRLVKEMRVAGISTIEEANQFLESFWIPFWDERFAVAPADPKDRHRRLPKKASVQALFAETWARVLANDFTFRFKNRRYQIDKEEARGIRPKDKITIEHRVDGSRHFRWKNRYLTPELIAEYHAKPIHVQGPRRPCRKTPFPEPCSNGTKSNGKTASKPKQKSTPQRPAPDHPWRNSRIGRGPREFTPGNVKDTST
jgi:hypothetical protein